MPYTVLSDFRGGLSRRREPIAGEEGTLYQLTDAHITDGMEIETRKKFVKYTTLPAGTIGLHSIGTRKYVFGSAADPGGLPSDFTYIRMQHPQTTGEIPTLTDILSAESFQGVVYSIGKFSDGTVHHYFGGVIIEDWEKLQRDLSSSDDVVTFLADQIAVAGSGISAAADTGADRITVTGAAYQEFEVSTGVREIATPTGVSLSIISSTPPVEPVTAKASSYSLRCVSRFTSFAYYELRRIVVATEEGDKDLLDYGNDGALVWTGQDTGETFAVKVVDRINSNTTGGNAHGFVATRSVNVVTITAPLALASAANGDVVTLTKGGVTIEDVDGNTFKGGVVGVTGAQQQTVIGLTGTFNENAEYFINIDGVEYSVQGYISDAAVVVKAHRSKLYAINRSLLRFCGIAAPTRWIDGIGSGYINLSNQDTGSTDITAMGLFQGKLAFFGRDVVQIWSISEDEAQNRLVQTLRSTGTRFAKSVVEWGGSDTFFLSDTGIRSLRIRDQIDAPFVQDIGSPIDRLVRSDVALISDAQAAAITGLIEPLEGRLWMSIGEKIYVLSYFPATKVSAWAVYNPGFNVEAMTVSGGRVWLRSGNDIYIYGGVTGDVYPLQGEVTAIMRTPFMGLKRDAEYKGNLALDMAAVGSWEVRLFINPASDNDFIASGTIEGITYRGGRIQVPGSATHMSIEARSSSAGRKVISQITLHYDVLKGTK